MFDVFCPRDGARVLLGPRSIRALWRSDEGLVAAYRCHCGHEGTELFAHPARRRVLQPA